MASRTHFIAVCMVILASCGGENASDSPDHSDQDGGASGSGGSVSSDGWSTVSSPTKEPLYAVWGADPDNVWIVGAHGTVLRSNADGLHALPALCSWQLSAVHGFGPNDVWISGEHGALFHFDGTQFHEDATFSGGGVYLNGLSGTSGRDVWVVGRKGGETLPDSTVTPLENLAGHWDGSTWTAATLPPMVRNPSLQYTRAASELMAVHAVDAEHVWTVGDQGEILRYDGDKWIAEDNSRAPWLLRGVWGVGERAFAVGGAYAAVHGVAAQSFEVDMAGQDGLRSLDSVSGSDEANLWAVGWWVRPGMASGCVMRWNGTEWTEQSTPLPSASTVWLHGVWVLPSGEAWAVGTDGTVLRHR